MKAKVLSGVFKLCNQFLQLKNAKRRKIFVYTDSRGFNVVSRLGKTPFESYIRTLAWNFNVEYYICPEKFTTIIDFLECVKKKDIGQYDVVLLHCGVVDFSPRPLSNIGKLLESKRGSAAFDKLRTENRSYHSQPYDVVYSGEKTITLYSMEYLSREVIPQLKQITNLVWINSNHFVKGWEGNFTKGRPANIEKLVNEYDALLMQNLANVIDLKIWGEKEIMENTIDNIHFTKKGFDQVYKLLHGKLESIAGKL